VISESAAKHRRPTNLRPRSLAWPLICLTALAAASGLSALAAEPSPAKPKKPRRGLAGEYYSGTDFEELKSTHVDPKIDFAETEKFAAGRTAGAKKHSIRWKGQVKSDVDGEYTFIVISEGLSLIHI